jgi:hypothetical protein
MKNLIMILASSAIFGSLLSCKKEAKIDIEDQPNANFRILKIEQTKQLVTPPFGNFPSGLPSESRFTVQYEYLGDTSIVANVSRSDQPNNVYQYSIYKSAAKEFTMIFPPPFTRFCYLGSPYCGMARAVFKFDSDRLTSVVNSSTVLSSELGFALERFGRTISYTYNNKLSGVRTILDGYGVQEEIFGDTVGQAEILTWNENQLFSIKTSDFLGYCYLFDLDSINVRNFLDKGRIFEIELEYVDVPQSMPKELIRKVNQQLSGVLRGPLEDYTYNWQIDFLFPGNNFLKPFIEGGYSGYVTQLQSSDKTILADWLWSFVHPSFNVLPVQDKLIASKRISGRKIVDIIDGQPIYANVDSTALFPYTFDPIAKTLEIAGLKIWYEVVE